MLLNAHLDSIGAYAVVRQKDEAGHLLEIQINEHEIQRRFLPTPPTPAPDRILSMLRLMTISVAADAAAAAAQPPSFLPHILRPMRSL